MFGYHRLSANVARFDRFGRKDVLSREREERELDGERGRKSKEFRRQGH